MKGISQLRVLELVGLAAAYSTSLQPQVHVLFRSAERLRMLLLLWYIGAACSSAYGGTEEQGQEQKKIEGNRRWVCEPRPSVVPLILGPELLQLRRLQRCF